MTQAVGIARAHTNIALIKYWGKREGLIFTHEFESIPDPGCFLYRYQGDL